MVKHTASSKIEVLACASASLLLGAYLTSSTDHLVMQTVMFSFPPATLLMALRRAHVATTRKTVALQVAPDPLTLEEVTIGLEFDILTRAS